MYYLFGERFEHCPHSQFLWKNSMSFLKLLTVLMASSVNMYPSNNWSADPLRTLAADFTVLSWLLHPHSETSHSQSGPFPPKNSPRGPDIKRKLSNKRSPTASPDNSPSVISEWLQKSPLSQQDYGLKVGVVPARTASYRAHVSSSIFLLPPPTSHWLLQSSPGSKLPGASGGSLQGAGEVWTVSVICLAL